MWGYESLLDAGLKTIKLKIFKSIIENMILNLNIKNKESGYTLIEILVAVFIMSTGFLALSQMEFLSLRQKQMAEAGSNATNLVQAAADNDLSELKRVALLNSQTFITEVNGNTADYTYCDGSTDASVCNNCPCNPLARVATDPTTVGTKATECAAVGLNSSDVKKITFKSTDTDCINDYKNLGTDGLILLRRASVGDADSSSTIITSIYTVNLTYSVKSLEQFVDSDFSLLLKDNLAVQGIAVTAQTEDYSDTVPVSSGAWGFVVVPYVP